LESKIEAVRLANEAFYQAFEKLDIRSMEPLWSKEAHVKCVHPGWEARLGWKDVRDSWVVIFNHTHEIKFEVDVLDITVNGEWGWTLCVEQISTQDQGKWVNGRVIGTNLFEHRNGQWLLIHHHGSPQLTIEEKSSDDSSNGH
jgi:ketosteroid isomerase-like protein